MSTTAALDRKLEHHFTIFVYPFQHRFEGKVEQRQLTRILHEWLPWFCRLDEEKIKSALDDSYFFLPFAKRLLLPEFEQTPNTIEGRRKLISLAQDFRSASPETVCQKIAEFPTQHLSYRNEGLERIKNIRLVSEFGKRFEQDIEVEWVDLYVLPQETGFLVIKMHLSDKNASISQLIEFNNLMRQVLPPKVDWVVPRLLAPACPDVDSAQSLVEFLLKDLTPSYLLGPENVQHSESLFGHIYGDRFFVYSYSCIDLPEDLDIESVPHEPFKDAVDMMLYEYGTCAGLGSSTVQGSNFLPSTEYVEELISANKISLWKLWRGFALRETVTYLATKKNQFHLTYFPQNIENDYFNLYIYSLYQKIQLFKFSTALLQEDNNPKESMVSTRKLLDRFMEFRNKFWFVEVTKRPQGDYIYEKYQEGLKTLDLFEAVDDEISDLNEYYEARLSRNVSTLLNILTIYFVPVSAILAVFGMSTIASASPWQFSPEWIFYALGAVLLVSTMVWIWWSRR
jgi:hypothetical protein